MMKFWDCFFLVPRHRNDTTAGRRKNEVVSLPFNTLLATGFKYLSSSFSQRISMKEC